MYDLPSIERFIKVFYRQLLTFIEIFLFIFDSTLVRKTYY